MAPAPSPQLLISKCKCKGLRSSSPLPMPLCTDPLLGRQAHRFQVDASWPQGTGEQSWEGPKDWALKQRKGSLLAPVLYRVDAAKGRHLVLP